MHEIAAASPPIPVPKYSLVSLLHRAKLHHNTALKKVSHTPAHLHPQFASDTSDPIFLLQLQIQYLQHILSKGPKPIAPPGPELDAAILSAYPHLQDAFGQLAVTDPNPALLTSTQIKERGWTASLMKRFLPEPDRLKINPHHKQGPPMKLFLQARIEALEGSSDFQQAKQQLARRQAGAQQAVITKRDALIRAVNALHIQVPRLEEAELTRRAIGHYNRRNNHREDHETATTQSDSAFLERIIVNYVRHQLTRYEDDLATLYGRVGTADGYALLSQKVFAAIAQTYPTLAGECRRQLNARRD